MDDTKKVSPTTALHDRFAFLKHFFSKKRNIVITVIVAVILIGGGIFLSWWLNRSHQLTEAEKMDILGQIEQASKPVSDSIDTKERHAVFDAIEKANENNPATKLPNDEKIRILQMMQQ